MKSASGINSRDELNCVLAADILRQFGRLRFRATGSSMIPVIWPGDILQVHAAEIGQVSPGDVILFSRESSLCAHRVLSIGESVLITAGYSIPTPDRPVTQDELLGRVVSLSRNGKEVLLRQELPLAQRLAALVFRRANWLLRCYIRVQGAIARLRRRDTEESLPCSALR